MALDPKLGYYAFEYDRPFIASGIELAPLAMPLAKAREPFVFVDLPKLTFKGLPAMLADALPDDFGNSLIDAWMAGRGVAKSRITPLDRLAHMGKRGTGALELRPSRSRAAVGTTALKLSRLVESARSAVHGEIGSDQLAKAALAQIIQVGIGTAPQVLKQVGEAISAWPDFSAKAGVRPAESRRILEHHQVL